MRLTKYVAVIGMVASFGLTSQADIAYQVASSGIYHDDGSWAGGAWTEAGFLYQAIWSDVDPSGHDAGPGGSLANNGGANEFILFSQAGVQSYGYIQYADTPGAATQSDDSDVGGLDINNGFLYFRIFTTSAPVGGDKLYQSPAIQTSGLANVDLGNPPINPGDIAQINSTGGGPEASNKTVIPEPTTLALLALSGVMIALRRTRRD